MFADSDEEAMDEETKAHKRDFEKKRAMHYGQEAAVALKKAREMEEDDDDTDEAETRVNGANGVA